MHNPSVATQEPSPVYDLLSQLGRFAFSSGPHSNSGSDGHSSFLSNFLYFDAFGGASVAGKKSKVGVSASLSLSSRGGSHRCRVSPTHLEKIEQEKLEKLARKGPKPEEKPAGSSGGSVSDAKPSASSSGASTPKVSTDKYRNCAIVAGVMTAAASLGGNVTGAQGVVVNVAQVR
ncbi:hypothetical protein ACFX19_022823 [Malus domestica]